MTQKSEEATVTTDDEKTAADWLRRSGVAAYIEDWSCDPTEDLNEMTDSLATLITAKGEATTRAIVTWLRVREAQRRAAYPTEMTGLRSYADDIEAGVHLDVKPQNTIDPDQRCELCTATFRSHDKTPPYPFSKIGCRAFAIKLSGA